MSVFSFEPCELVKSPGYGVHESSLQLVEQVQLVDIGDDLDCEVRSRYFAANQSART